MQERCGQDKNLFQVETSRVTVCVCLCVGVHSRRTFLPGSAV